jgi:hypothetical protein
MLHTAYAHFVPCRFLRLDSPTPYFTTGKVSKGLYTTTDVLEVCGEEEAFQPLQILIQVLCPGESPVALFQSHQ